MRGTLGSLRVARQQRCMNLPEANDGAWIAWALQRLALNSGAHGVSPRPACAVPLNMPDSSTVVWQKNDARCGQP